MHTIFQFTNKLKSRTDSEIQKNEKVGLLQKCEHFFNYMNNFLKNAKIFLNFEQVYEFQNIL